MDLFRIAEVIKRSLRLLMFGLPVLLLLAADETTIKGQLILGQHSYFVAPDSCAGLPRAPNCFVFLITPGTPKSMTPGLNVETAADVPGIGAFLRRYLDDTQKGRNPRSVEVVGRVVAGKGLGPGRGFGYRGSLGLGVVVRELRYPKGRNERSGANTAGPGVRPK